MGRRTIRWISLTLAIVFAGGSVARAQNDGAIQPVSTILPAVPVIDVPLEPVTTELPKFDLRISPNTNVPLLERTPEVGGNVGMAQMALESNEYLDPRYVKNSLHPDDMCLWEHFRTGTGEQLHRLGSDYKNFYLSENVLLVGAAIAIAAPIANTHADHGIRDWYQRGAGNSRGADNAANFFRAFGDWQYAVPIYVALSLSEHVFPDSPTFHTLGEFGNRSLRALAVGAPTVGVLQPVLGAGRPPNGDSNWNFFDHGNGVSGHAFVGAVPFLTAASMTDNYALKTLFIAGSFGPAWSRIQQDQHYFSQVLLGWSIAYLSVESVNWTECRARNMRLVPVELPRGVGLGMQLDY